MVQFFFITQEPVFTHEGTRSVLSHLSTSATESKFQRYLFSKQITSARTHWTRPLLQVLLQGCGNKRRSAEHWARPAYAGIWHIPHLFSKLWELPSLACNSSHGAGTLSVGLAWTSGITVLKVSLSSPRILKSLSPTYVFLFPLFSRPREPMERIGIASITSVVVIKQSWLKSTAQKMMCDLLSNYESVFSPVEKTLMRDFILLTKLFIEHLL